MASEFISERVKRVLSGDDNPFMQLLAIASKYDHVVTLGRGDPDLPTPQHVIDAGIAALQRGDTKYTPPVGLLQLRKAVAEKYQREHGLTYDPESEIIITSGTQEAIFVTMHSLINPGDEVIIPEPYYACYAESAKMAGGIVVPARTFVEDNFEVSVNEIARCITPKTKLIALLSPSNPSGTIVPRETMEGIAKLVKEHNLFVLCDELYESIMYDGKKPVCFASMPDMQERTIVVNGFSKAYAMTGLRVGFMVGPKYLVKSISVPHHSITICANTVGQYAALAAITGDQSFLAEYRDLYDVRRKIVMEELDAAGIPYARPSGGFFVFADIRKTGLHSFDFCKQLIEATRVQVFPGTMYGEGMDGYIRISFLAEKDTLRQAIKDLGEFYNRICK